MSAGTHGAACPSKEPIMAAVSVRNLDHEVKERLRVQAAEHGRSLEAEIRAILTNAVRGPGEHHLGKALLEAFGDLGGVDLDLPARDEPPRAADLA